MRSGRSDPGQGSGPPKYPGSFLLALREAAAALNWRACQCKGQRALCIDASGREHVIGLDNLYRRARQAGARDTWPALITDFLRTVEGIGAAQEVPADLRAVADQLLVRLGNVQAPVPADRPWAQPLAGTGLFINLVIDYPDRLCYVTESMMAASGSSPQVWLQRALENLHARTPADCLPIVHPETGIRLCALGDSYDSSRALLLDRLMPEVGPDGLFVALPVRDQLLALTVSREALGHVHLLRGYAQKSYRTLPYPISDQVFWVREGEWHLFAITLQPDQVIIRPPERFLEVLRRLMPEETDTEPEGPAV